jgi:hypothetical protein
MQEATDAVRAYLLYLRDPSTLVDEDEIATAEQALADAKKTGDPLAELDAHAGLERARTADPRHVEDAFVANAKAYADHRGISAQAWRSMGVPDDMLRRAGLLAGSGTRATTAETPAAKRRTRVSREQVVDAIRHTSGTFSIADIAEVTGASGATVRKVVSDLIDADEVVEMGEDPEHDGRGRAPILYANA